MIAAVKRTIILVTLAAGLIAAFIAARTLSPAPAWRVEAVQPLESPAATAGSAQPQLSVQSDRLLMSWVEILNADATLKVAERHFAILEQSKPEGVILAERSGIGGGWIGIYLTAVGADSFRVEVVREGKYAGQIAWTNWPRTVVREVQAALGETPAR